ncbi:MAG: hypothetical protein ACE5K8_01030 [Candidatus Zixiibacteriota bacterium]
MKHFTAFIVWGVTAVFIVSCAQSDKKVILRYKFNPGTRLTYEQVSKSHAKTFEADSLIKEESRMFDMTVEQTVTRRLGDSTAEVVEIAVWPTVKPNEADSTVVDTIEDRRQLILQVQSNGRVRNVRLGAEEDYTQISYIKNYYEQGLPVFPRDPVRPGYSWTQTTKVVLPNEPMEASMSYQVTSFLRQAGYDCAVIECQGNMVIPLEPNPKDTIQTSGLDLITTTGVLYFAYKEGFVVHQRELWLIDRDRRMTHQGKTKQYREKIELDIDYVLKKHAIVDSLAS